MNTAPARSPARAANRSCFPQAQNSTAVPAGPASGNRWRPPSAKPGTAASAWSAPRSIAPTAAATWGTSSTTAPARPACATA
ncbi:hypothetical protein G6F59_018878 [Rhizopus arrhizus]|nr:hypothetical protein G6F59_018878 [Rhizopus arrhizus]